MTMPTPPAWAERLLRLQVAPRDREPVSGDLLELYRDHVDATGDVWRTDVWYVLEVCRWTWTEHGPWIVLFAAASLSRTWFDWLVPTHDFSTRSMWTTAASATLMFAAGFSSTWRLRSIASAGIAAFVASVGGGLLHAIGALVLLAARHDPGTLAAIRGSGGLSEAMTLPLMVSVPAAFIGAMGGTLAWLTRVSADAIEE